MPAATMGVVIKLLEVGVSIGVGTGVGVGVGVGVSVAVGVGKLSARAVPLDNGVGIKPANKAAMRQPTTIIFTTSVNILAKDSPKNCCLHITTPKTNLDNTGKSPPH